MSIVDRSRGMSRGLWNGGGLDMAGSARKLSARESQQSLHLRQQARPRAEKKQVAGSVFQRLGETQRGTPLAAVVQTTAPRTYLARATLA